MKKNLTEKRMGKRPKNTQKNREKIRKKTREKTRVFQQNILRKNAWKNTQKP